jgi:hypothetical protein
MSWITRLLVVANRTAGSEELADALHRRAEGGGLSVTLVMPSPLGQYGVAHERLNNIIDRLRATGIAADGTLGDNDPVNAALEAWDPMRYDEIVVCTLPPGESTWLHIDLPHRLRRLTDATVQHVVALPDGAVRAA